eukprot:350023-Chlamydomonas_euryale.AAC.2
MAERAQALQVRRRWGGQGRKAGREGERMCTGEGSFFKGRGLEGGEWKGLGKLGSLFSREDWCGGVGGGGAGGGLGAAAFGCGDRVWRRSFRRGAGDRFGAGASVGGVGFDAGAFGGVECFFAQEISGGGGRFWRRSFRRLGIGVAQELPWVGWTLVQELLGEWNFFSQKFWGGGGRVWCRSFRRLGIEMGQGSGCAQEHSWEVGGGVKVQDGAVAGRAPAPACIGQQHDVTFLPPSPTNLCVRPVWRRRSERGTPWRRHFVGSWRSRAALPV